MCKINHVDFYADDWISGTSDLTLEQRGFYITACALIYSRGGAVTRDHLQRVCAVHGRTFNALLRKLVDLGKLVENDGKIGQKRCENELKNARNRVKKWLKNLDIPDKSTTYADRAAGNAGARTPVSTNYQEEETLEPRGSKGADAPPTHPHPMQNSELETDAPDPPEPRDRIKEVWDRGVAVLGRSSRSLIGKCRRDYGDLAVMEAIIATEAECASEPVEFFVGCLQRATKRPAGFGNTRQQSPVATLWDAAAALALEIEEGRHARFRPDGTTLDYVPLSEPLLVGYGTAGRAECAARGLA